MTKQKINQTVISGDRVLHQLDSVFNEPFKDGMVLARLTYSKHEYTASDKHKKV